MFKEDKNGVIRDERGLWVKGQSGNPKGAPRRGRAAEQREAVAHLQDTAIEQLGKALGEGKPWAIQLTLEYGLGRPTDHVELDVDTRPHIELEFPAIIDPVTLPANHPDDEADEASE